MTTCRNCGLGMGILPIITLQSNDNRMDGNYCSRKCIKERRDSIPPFNDLSYLNKKNVEKPEKEKEIPAPEPETTIDDQGLNILFGNEGASGLSKLFEK